MISKVFLSQVPKSILTMRKHQQAQTEEILQNTGSKVSMSWKMGRIKSCQKLEKTKEKLPKKVKIIVLKYLYPTFSNVNTSQNHSAITKIKNITLILLNYIL